MRREGAAVVSALLLLAGCGAAFLADPVGPPQVETLAIGGTRVDQGTYSWQVALIDVSLPGVSVFDGFFCGGTLVADHFVLTAAHCVAAKEADKIEVYSGAVFLPGGGQPNGNGRRARVCGVFLLRNGAGQGDPDDIALLQLEAGLPGRAVNRPLDAEVPVSPGQRLTVVGWGRTDVNGRHSQYLMQTVVVVQSEGCRDGLVCSTPLSGMGSPCKGDSGGALLMPTAGGGKMQIGVISDGGCGADIAEYAPLSPPKTREWIERTLRRHSCPQAGR